MQIRSLLMTLFLVLMLAGCASQPSADFDLRGEWEYTLTTTDGNTYDAGTITFEGEPAKGTYQQLNIYQVDYEGEFTVRGTVLKLTGYETWEGTVMDANTIEGVWSHDDGSNGTFTARRK
jgi:hypothetical protein